MAKEINVQFSGRIGPLIGCLRDDLQLRYVVENSTRPAAVKTNKFTAAVVGAIYL